MLGIPGIGFGQHGDKGKSNLGYSNEPLVGATVQVFNTAQGTITDIDGSFELTGVKMCNDQ
jgi:hypothetical protein